MKSKKVKQTLTGLVKAATKAASRKVRKPRKKYTRVNNVSSVPAIEEGRMPKHTFKAEMKGTTALISGKDLLGPVTASADGAIGDKLFECNTYLPEIGVNTRLGTFAGLYQRFTVVKMKLHFSHSLGTQYTGAIVGWATDDCTDNIVNSGMLNLQKANAYTSMKEEPVYKDMVIDLPLTRGTYYCSSNLVSNDRLSQPGYFYMIWSVPGSSVNGPIPGGTTLGYAWLEYSILFSYPTYDAPHMEDVAGAIVAEGKLNPADMFSLSTIKNRGLCGLDTLAPNHLLVGCPGTFHISYGASGTGVSAGGMTVYDFHTGEGIVPTTNYDAIGAAGTVVAGYAVYAVLHAAIIVFPTFASTLSKVWAVVSYIIGTQLIS